MTSAAGWSCPGSPVPPPGPSGPRCAAWTASAAALPPGPGIPFGAQPSKGEKGEGDSKRIAAITEPL